MVIKPADASSSPRIQADVPVRAKEKSDPPPEDKKQAQESSKEDTGRLNVSA